MNIIFKLRDNANPKNLRKYVIKNIRVYPDLDLLFDNNKPLRFDSVAISGIRIFNLYKKFKPAFVASQIALKPGQLYRLSNYIRTYGNFSQLGAWSQVNISFLETRDSAATLDVDIRLYPAKKQDLSITLDGSYNTGNVFSAGIGGNLFGIGINFGLNNRNVARQAIQSSTNLRAGVELGIRNDQVGNFIQTIQANLSHTIIFPGLVLPNFIKRPSKSDSLRSQRTQLNFNASYADRRDYFLLRSLNVSWGYEWRIKKHAWYYSPFNVEFVDLQKRRLLDTLIKNLPSLQYAFNNGLIISQLVGYNYQNQYGRKRHLLRVGLEESGLIFGSFRRLDTEANLSRFVKLDVDYRHTINYRKTALVFRFYTGLGIPYGKRTRDTLEFQLPFFKSFVAGGPYSMRGWQIRRLGAGSAPKFYTGDTRLSDRFGDVQIEGNVEYRFDIGTVLGFKIKSALFTDIGNIWYRNNQNNPDLNNAVFRFSTAFRDLAIASGTSLRLDFSYFLIRLDWAYRIKDPAFANKNNGWLNDIRIVSGQAQLGINYPF
jgi:outer membrane protein assembly factor BamA